MGKREEVITEALKALVENNGGTAVMSTGTGKSKLAIDFAKVKKSKKILITSPRTTLKNNWKKELSKWKIHQLQEVEEDNLYGDYSDPTNPIYLTIDLVNIQTCYKWSEEELSDYDLIIIDEIHTIATEEYGNLVVRAKEIGITILGLTATPDDEKIEKLLFYFENCPIVYRYEDSAKDGIVNKRKYIVYEYELTDAFKVKVGAVKKTWFAGEKKQYDYIQSQIEEGEQLIRQCLKSKPDDFVNYYNVGTDWFWNKNEDKDKFNAGRKYANAVSARMNFLWNLTSTNTISKIMCKHIINTFEDSKILVFSERNAQADKISTHTVHSKNKDEVNEKNIEMFDNGDIRQLGSCYSLTLGLNLNKANFAILESYNGSATQFKQRAGRMDRLPVSEEAIIIILVPKDTQAEKWFTTSIRFDEHDVVETVKSLSEFREVLNKFKNG